MIPYGTRVLIESPLLRVHYEAAFDKIVGAFEGLTPDQQSSYLKLSDYEREDLKEVAAQEMGRPWDSITNLHQKVIAIHATNTFNNGVVLLGSRFNHSCTPNLHFAYNKTLEKQTFHSVRGIQAGEELFIMYIDGTYRTRPQRQNELKQDWGFVCTCPACEDTPQGNDKEMKRTELYSLNQELSRNISFGGEDSWEGP